jgi:hypothetical protein
VIGFDIVLARWFSDAITWPRARRIEMLKAALKAAGATSPFAPFLFRALKAEESDEAYATWAKVNPIDVDYKQHLLSRYWRRLRAYRAVLQRWRCAECNEPFGLELELHHEHYRTVGHETLDDVRSLGDATRRRTG